MPLQIPFFRLRFLQHVLFFIFCSLLIAVPLKAQASEEHTNWTTYAGITSLTAATIAAFHYDQSISDHLSNWKINSSFVRTVSPALTTFGNGVVIGGFLGGFALYGYVTNDTLALKTAFLGTTAFLVSGIAGMLLKHSFGRERPFVSTRPNGFWHGPFAYFIPAKRNGKSVDSFDSFPSGHTISSFCVATILADSYSDSYVPYVSYSLATLILISRVVEKEHWLSDCFAGAIIGYGGAKLTERCFRSASWYNILPFVSSKTVGVLIVAKL